MGLCCRRHRSHNNNNNNFKALQLLQQISCHQKIRNQLHLPPDSREENKNRVYLILHFILHINFSISLYAYFSNIVSSMLSNVTHTSYMHFNTDDFIYL
ncbi:hypothetical protein FKM82_003961 [Ascaphus truei]